MRIHKEKHNYGSDRGNFYDIYVNDTLYIEIYYDSVFKSGLVRLTKNAYSDEHFKEVCIAMNEADIVLNNLKTYNCAHINTHNVESDYGEEFTVCNDCGEGWH